MPVTAAASNWSAPTTIPATTPDNASSSSSPAPPVPPSLTAGSSEGEGERKRHAVAMASVVTEFSLAG